MLCREASLPTVLSMKYYKIIYTFVLKAVFLLVEIDSQQSQP